LPPITLPPIKLPIGFPPIGFPPIVGPIALLGAGTQSGTGLTANAGGFFGSKTPPLPPDNPAAGPQGTVSLGQLTASLADLEKAFTTPPAASALKDPSVSGIL
jgi:hypothetical protein